MHPRRQIRNDYVAALIAADGPAADRIFPTMTPRVSVESVLREEGPVVFCYVRDEEIKEEGYDASGQNGSCRRELELAVEGLVIGDDDALDDLAEWIEGVLEGFVPPSHPASECRLHHTQLDLTEAFGSVLGGVFMTYKIKYYTPFRTVPDPPFDISFLYVEANATEAELILDPTSPNPGPEVNDVEA